MNLFSKEFWNYAGERALKTLAQAGSAYLATGFTGLLEIDLLQLMSVAGLAALASVFTSIYSQQPKG